MQIDINRKLYTNIIIYYIKDNFFLLNIVYTLQIFKWTFSYSINIDSKKRELIGLMCTLYTYTHA